MSKLFVKSEYDLQENKAVASTSVVDRQGEIIDQSGWDLRNFKKNPVLLWGHDHTEPAIGTAKNIKVEGAGKQAKLTFNPIFHELTDKARAIKALFEAGILNSFSVGFQPIESEGNMYTKQELLEISGVNVPANPEARTMAMKTLDGVVDKAIAEQVVGEKMVDPMTQVYDKVQLAVGAHEITMAHMQDIIAIIGTAQDSPGGSTEGDTRLKPGAEDDNGITNRSTQSQLDEMKEQLEDVVKGLKHLNPQVDRQATAKVRQEAKTIVRNADKILAKNHDQVQAKVVKRAAEKLIALHK